MTYNIGITVWLILPNNILYTIHRINILFYIFLNVDVYVMKIKSSRLTATSRWNNGCSMINEVIGYSLKLVKFKMIIMNEGKRREHWIDANIWTSKNLLHILEKSIFIVFNTCLSVSCKRVDGIFVENSWVSLEEVSRVVFEWLKRFIFCCHLILIFLWRPIKMNIRRSQVRKIQW